MGGRIEIWKAKNLLAAPQDVGDEITHIRYGCRNGGRNGRRPVAQLGPGKQIPAEPEGDGYEEEKRADDPGKLPRPLVVSHEENRQHVREDDPDQQVAAHDVHLAEQPAEGNLVHDALHALEGVVRMGNIVDEKEDARDHLDQIPRDGDDSQGIEDIDIFRHPVCADLLFNKVIDSDPDVEPVPHTIPHSFHPITIFSPSTLSGRTGRGFGGGPEITCPSRSKVPAWHGQSS